MLAALGIILGIAILLFGLWYQAKPAADDEKKPGSLHPLYTFGFGMLVMLNEITTALPYFVAIEQIAQQKLPLLGNLMALALYNAIFALPLVAFLGLFLLFQERFARGIAAIHVWSQVWIPRIVKG